MDGAIPNVNDSDRTNTYKLVNNWKIFMTAKNLVTKNLEDKEINQAIINHSIRNLVITEDFTLMSQLLKFSKKAVEGYNDQELSVLVADKRINDFKDALKLRNILSMDSLSTYGWLIYQQRKNNKIISSIPSYEELFFKEAMPSLVDN